MILKGKTAIVTGGARDIGRAISVKLASMGANVCVNYFNKKSDADATLELIKANGGNAIAVKADVTKMEECQAKISVFHYQSNVKCIHGLTRIPI